MKLKLHAKRELSYDPQTTGIVWTRCFRNVTQAQIAAFDDGVTCKNCRKHIDFEKEWEAEQAARKAKEAA